jgi:hypothetical protein
LSGTASADVKDVDADIVEGRREERQRDAAKFGGMKFWAEACRGVRAMATKEGTSDFGGLRCSKT